MKISHFYFLLVMLHRCLVHDNKCLSLKCDRLQIRTRESFSLQKEKKNKNLWHKYNLYIAHVSCPFGKLQTTINWT